MIRSLRVALPLSLLLWAMFWAIAQLARYAI